MASKTNIIFQLAASRQGSMLLTRLSAMFWISFEFSKLGQTPETNSERACWLVHLFARATDRKQN